MSAGDRAASARAVADRPGRLPTVRLELRRSVPAWSLRIAIALAGALAILALGPGPLAAWLLVAGLLGCCALPTGATGAVLVGTLGIAWSAGNPPWWAQLVALAAAPMCWVIAGAVADLPLRTRVEVRTLRHALGRYVLVELAAAPTLLGALGLQGQLPDPGPGVTMVAIALATMLAVSAWIMLPRLATRHPDRRV